MATIPLSVDVLHPKREDAGGSELEEGDNTPLSSEDNERPVSEDMLVFVSFAVTILFELEIARQATQSKPVYLNMQTNPTRKGEEEHHKGD